MFRLAWRNLWRQPRRSILSLLSIGFAAFVMVIMLAFQVGIYDQMKSNVLGVFTGYAQIQAPGYQDKQDIRKVIPHPDHIISRVEQLGLKATPRAMGFVIISSRKDEQEGNSLGTAVTGVDPQREPKLSSLARNITSGRYLKPGDTDAVVLGDTLAKNLRVKTGDKVTILGSARDGSIAADALTVVGTFASGAPQLDRQMAEIPLPRFQDDFLMGNAVNSIVVSAPRLDDVLAHTNELKHIATGAGATLQTWQQLEPGLNSAIHLDASTSMLWYTSLIVVVVFIILNTLMMSVLERTREFGVLLALGMRQSLLGRVVWTELFLLAGVGIAVGIAVALPTLLWAQSVGINLPGTEGLFRQWGLTGKLYPEISTFTLLLGPGVIAAGIALSGVFPYRRIRRLEPVSAMRAA